MSLLPHTTQPITSEPASYEMRAWMEMIQSASEVLAVFNNITVIGGSYTASNLDFINAKSNAVISLTNTPPVNSVIIVRNGDGSSIRINGNGRTINEQAGAILKKKETAIVIHYFSDSDEWLIR